MNAAERCDGTGWVRREAGGSVHLAGRYDVSAEHTTYPTGYDSRCNWCWLNATHSEDAHADQVAWARAYRLGAR